MEQKVLDGKKLRVLFDKETGGKHRGTKYIRGTKAAGKRAFKKWKDERMKIEPEKKTLRKRNRKNADETGGKRLKEEISPSQLAMIDEDFISKRASNRGRAQKRLDEYYGKRLAAKKKDVNTFVRNKKNILSPDNKDHLNLYFGENGPKIYDLYGVDTPTMTTEDYNKMVEKVAQMTLKKKEAKEKKK